MAEESAAESSAPPSGSSGGKPIILYILVVLNMLVVGAVGFMVKKGREQDQKAAKIDDVIQGEAKAQHEEAIKEPEFIGTLIPMEMFVVNLSGASGHRLLKVHMELEVEGEKVQEEIEKRKPEIRDMIITLLSSKTHNQVSSQEGKEYLREEIRETLNFVLKNGKIRRVLFTEFIYN